MMASSFENVLDLFDMERYSEDDVVRLLGSASVDDQLEFYKVLEKMYFHSKTRVVHNLIRRLFMDDSLEMPDILRVQVIYTLDANDVDDEVMNRLYDMIEQSTELEAITKFDVLRYVFRTYASYSHKYVTLLKSILSSPTFDEDFRYRSMLESRTYLPSKAMFTDVMMTCFYDASFSTRNKILLCQYAMNHRHHYNGAVFDHDIALQFLVSILCDGEMNDDYRMDVADILLNMESVSDELRAQAIAIIDQYGTRKNRFSFYHNQENVHYVDVTSIQGTLEYLNHKFPFANTHHRMDRVVWEIKEFEHYKSLPDDDQKKVNVALIRIQNDRSTYGSHNNTLHDVLCMVYACIQSHVHAHALRGRLMEELLDMSGKCATGYVIRLVNVLSGFDDNFKVMITAEESMKSALFHRLNQRIFEMEDEDLKNDILYELTLPSSLAHMRSHFLKFFREVFPSLKDDLYQEFKDQMTDTDFDLYLKRIVVNYEGYSYV